MAQASLSAGPRPHLLPAKAETFLSYRNVGGRAFSKIPLSGWRSLLSQG